MELNNSAALVMHIHTSLKCASEAEKSENYMFFVLLVTSTNVKGIGLRRFLHADNIYGP